MRFAEYIRGVHSLAEFDCGNAAMNDFLQQAGTHGVPDGEHLWVSLDDSRAVVGFISTQICEVELMQRAGVSVIPAVNLAAMGVTSKLHRSGLGGNLFARALVTCVSHPAYSECEAFLCLPKHIGTIRMCENFGFVPFPTKPGYFWLSRHAVERMLRL